MVLACKLILLLQVFADDDAAHHHEAERHACVSYDAYEFEVGLPLDPFPRVGYAMTAKGAFVIYHLTVLASFYT